MGCPIEEFVHPEDRARTAALFAAQVERGERAIRFGNRYRHRDVPPPELNASPDVEHGLVYAVATCLDAQLAAERLVRCSADRLRHAALHVPLTGLPNRTFLAVRLGVALDARACGKQR